MTDWQPAVLRKEALCEVEARIKLDHESIALRFERACLLNEMGRIEDAKQAYLDVLTRCPGHVGALNNLGTLLYFSGYRTAARSAYAEAIRQHPDQPMAHVNLGNIFLESGELAAAREHYEAALSIDSGFAEAHQGLGNLLAELGNEKAAAQHQRLGHRDRRPTELPYRGEAEPVSLLLLTSGRRGDVPIRHLLDDKIFRTFVVLPNVFDPDAPLPEHQVVFNSIGDADLCKQALDRTVTLMDRTFESTTQNSRQPPWKHVCSRSFISSAVLDKDRTSITNSGAPDIHPFRGEAWRRSLGIIPTCALHTSCSGKGRKANSMVTYQPTQILASMRRSWVCM